jgi:transposase InsO family protein
MCSVLKLPRSTFYYEQKTTDETFEDPFKQDVIRVFKESRNNYGTRRIKKALASEDIILSRRRIKQIMQKQGLISNYTVAHYKVHKTMVNEAAVDNVLNRKFDEREQLEVVVSDLTYVRVNGKWNYVCLILDLHNREIIGYSAGKHKDAKLVVKAMASIPYDLRKVTIFHTDRGNEFKNNAIDTLLDTFEINRSLSHKGCPYDNAVAEATFKTFKVEFVYPNVFETLNHLKMELFDYVNWYNNIRLHSSLDYMPPIKYKERNAI